MNRFIVDHPSVCLFVLFSVVQLTDRIFCNVVMKFGALTFFGPRDKVQIGPLQIKRLIVPSPYMNNCRVGVGYFGSLQSSCSPSFYKFINNFSVYSNGEMFAICMLTVVHMHYKSIPKFLWYLVNNIPSLSKWKKPYLNYYKILTICLHIS